MDTPSKDGADHVFMVEFHEGVLVVVPLADFGSLRWPEMEVASKCIFEAMRDDNSARVLVDMSRVNQCGSALLGIMLKVWKSVCPKSGALVFCNVSSDVADVLKMTRLDTLWAIYPSREAAFSALREPAL